MTAFRFFLPYLPKGSADFYEIGERWLASVPLKRSLRRVAILENGDTNRLGTARVFFSGTFRTF